MTLIPLKDDQALSIITGKHMALITEGLHQEKTIITVTTKLARRTCKTSLGEDYTPLKLKEDQIPDAAGVTDRPE